VLARCPSCRNTFSTDRSGRQECPVCGKPLVVPEAAQALAAEPLPPPEAAGPAGTPWERREELGLVSAWAETMRLALFEPSQLFASARLDRNPAQLGFVLSLSIFWMVGQLITLLMPNRPDQVLGMFSAYIPADKLEMVKSMLARNAQLNSPAITLLMVLLTPVVVWLLTYLNAGVTHLIALLFGQARRGFPATFAACAYGSAPLVLTIIPGCGSLIAAVWIVVLIGIGLKETHGISSRGAAATVLAPYLLLCFLCCGSVVLVALAVGRGMGAQ
jgi:hypothetical protein